MNLINNAKNKDETFLKFHQVVCKLDKELPVNVIRTSPTVILSDDPDSPDNTIVELGNGNKFIITITYLELLDCGFEEEYYIRSWIFKTDRGDIISSGYYREFDKSGTLMMEYLPDPKEPGEAVICITGTLSTTREKYIKIFESHGIRYTVNIRKDTNLLLMGDSPGEAKINAAKKNEITIIDTTFFLKYFRI